MKNILIICYSFPPFPGIGGRRWAKFAKYLAKDGYDVFVLGAQNIGNTNSLWTKDVIGERISYFSVKNKFYSFYHKVPVTLIEKVKYHFNKFFLRAIKNENYYDKSSTSIDAFYKKAESLINEHKINNLIITIAPNHLVKVGIRLKKKFPKLNFIFDIRDPWNICNDNWGQKSLSSARRKHELKLELKAAEIADKVISVYDVTTNFYKNSFPVKSENFITIPNGFDEDEIVVRSENLNNEKKQIVFAGSLYENVDFLFEEFLKTLLELNKKNTQLISEFQFLFYSPKHKQFDILLNKYKIDNVIFKPQVPLKEINNIISNATACMLFLPPEFEFSLSTKFYEYVARNKKIILFSQLGEVHSLFEKYNLGYAFSPETISESLEDALENINSGKDINALKPLFPVNDFSISHLSTLVKKILI